MDLRRTLRQSVNVVDDILGEGRGAYPVLRRQSAIPSRWLWVKLVAVVGQQTFTTTLAIRDDNVYCKGFRNQEGVWYELSGPANYPMLPWGNVEQLPEWDVSYSSILRAVNRGQVEVIMRSAGLGRASAETAVRRLALYPALDGRDDYLTRLSLANLIVMVCESARFNAVLETFVGGWDSGTGLSQRLARYMWEWGEMSHGLLEWREDGYRRYPLWSPLIQSAGHALSHIHLVLNYSEGRRSRQNKTAKDAQYCYNLHGKNSKSNNPEQDKGGPASKPTRGPSGSRQHSATNKKNVVSSGSPKDDMEDDRQIQSPEQTWPAEDDDMEQDPTGHPGEDDDDNAQGPDQPEDDDSSQGHRGNISERHGRPRVEIFALRANFHVTNMTVSVIDGIRGQIIYMPKEQQEPEAMEEEEMHHLALTGPYRGISAYGNFAIQVDMPSSATGGKEEDITWEWDRYNPEHAAQVDAPEPVTHAISLDSWRKIDVTYLVMSNAVEATVKVRLPETPQYYLPYEMMQGEQDVDGGSKYTARGTMTAHIGGIEKHPIVLFTSAVEVPIPSESLTLPLARCAVQVPQGEQLHIDMADLHITDCSSSREVKKPDNDSLSYDFGHVSPTPQFNNDTEEVQVNVTWTWRPQQNQEKIQVERHQVCIIGDKQEFSTFIRNLRRVLQVVVGQETSSRKQPTRWIHIELQVVAGQETSSTTLAVRDDKCYGVGFASQSGVWYDLGNRRGDRALPPEYSSILLDWGVSYKDILHASTWDEVVEELHSARPGKGFAEKAVRTLSRYPYVQEGDDTRLAVAGLFIMVCESAKFNPLHEHFVQAWDSGTGFPRQLMNYIRNCGHVSRAPLRSKDLGYDDDTRRHYFGQQPVGIISDPQTALDVVHLVFNNRDAPSTQVQIALEGKRDMEARYKVLTQDDLHARQAQDTRNVSELLSIAPGLAAVLLSHCHWSPERVQSGWFDNGDALRIAIGLPPSQHDVSGPKVLTLTHGKLDCQRCDDGAVRGARSLGCSHYYCDECWREHIRASVAVGGLPLRCPDRSCQVPVVRELVVEVADAEDALALYDHFVLRSYVDDSGGRIKWCGGSGCSRAVEFLGGGGDGESTDVFCECGHGFCWRCGGKPHRPVVPCDAARAWLDSKDELLENAVRELDEVKQFVSGTGLGEMDFLIEAFNEIAECRRKMRWVYVDLDLECHRDKGEIFARLVIDATGSIERLEACARDEWSKLRGAADTDTMVEAIGHTCSPSQTKVVMDLTTETRQHLENLLKAVETNFKDY